MALRILTIAVCSTWFVQPGAKANDVLPPILAALVSGAPPPLCPPHCVPPVPLPNPPICVFVLAGDTASGIEEYNRTGHYFCAPSPQQLSSKYGQGKLLVFFSGIDPSTNTLFAQSAASFGFHVLSLNFNNIGAPNGQCRAGDAAQTINDTSCEYDVEEERLFGGNRSAVLWLHRNRSWQLVNETNSIMYRLERALLYAGGHRIAGSDLWGTFVNRQDRSTSSGARVVPAAPSGQNIRWDRLVLSGWSRGSAYPVHISKYFTPARLVLFCGLEDYVGRRGPNSRPEPYIHQMPSNVPAASIWGVGGLHGSCCSNWMTNWGREGLRLPGQGFADDVRGNLLGHDAAALAKILNGSRRVYLRGPTVGHGTPIYDYTSAGIPRGRDGMPIYYHLWEYLLTSETPAGRTQFDEHTVPCCWIDHRMGEGTCAPRDCNSSVEGSCHSTVQGGFVV